MLTAWKAVWVPLMPGLTLPTPHPHQIPVKEIISFFQTRKVRLREVKPLAPTHSAMEARSGFLSYYYSKQIKSIYNGHYINTYLIIILKNKHVKIKIFPLPNQ